MTDRLLFDVKDKVATITLNYPEKLNAFNDEMLDAWVDRLEECRVRDDVYVIVLTGAGRGFCSGGDTSRMGAAETPTPMAIKSGLWDRVQRIPLKLQEIDKPVIAAVNGVAVGAGMDMSLHCDLRFAAESARFAETYVRVGLVPGNGAAYFLPRIVGVAKALELLWSSDFLSAQQALEIGLVNKVFPDDQLMEKTYEFATKVANSAPISVRMIKRTLYAGLNMDLRTSLDMVSSHMTLARSSEDHVEAIAAAREKRPPLFKNK